MSPAHRNPGGRDERGATWRRYLLWQLPGWLLACAALSALTAIGDAPWWIVPAGVAVLVVRDVALYPALRTTFRPADPPRPIGARGIVVEALRPDGMVRVGAELWLAHAAGDMVREGDHVVVTGAQGLTLVVVAAQRPPHER
jgi:membrane protein implicated in regulation of membrane protease activity